MPNKNNHWASPHKNGWQSKREGNKVASAVFDTQEEAWQDAIDRAKADKGEAFLQRKDGTIRERNTYRDDPFPPEG